MSERVLVTFGAFVNNLAFQWNNEGVIVRLELCGCFYSFSTWSLIMS